MHVNDIALRCRRVGFSSDMGFATILLMFYAHVFTEPIRASRIKGTSVRFIHPDSRLVEVDHPALSTLSVPCKY